MPQPILKKLSDAAALAIESNRAGYLVALGRAAGGEERDDGKVRWIMGGSPLDYYNAVVSARLAPGEVEEAIRDSLETMWETGVPGSWHLGPSMEPDDLSYYLEANGFVSQREEIGMAVELRALPQGNPSPAGLVIEAVTDQETLMSWAATLALQGEPGARWLAETLVQIEQEPGAPWRHYLARLDGKPVATATTFTGAGVVGLYSVFPLGEERQQPIGRAICLHALREAQAAGYRVGVVSASPASQPFYAKLGFRDYCRITTYIWAG
jgi:hypothetical protein